MNCFPIDLFPNQELATSCKCQIGGGVLNKPLTASCGHNFCLLCIQNSLDEEPKCPVCAKDLLKEQLIPSLNIQKLIEMLNIKCQHHDFECKWVGLTGKFADHLNQCEFTPGRCQFCSRDFKPDEISSHVEICPEKEIECDKCSQKMRLKESLEHRNECSDEIKACLRKCGFEGKRKFSKLHFDNGCPLLLQKCVYESMGCPFRGIRAELKEHLEDEGMQIHHQRLEIESRSKFQRSLNAKMNTLVLIVKENQKKFQKQIESKEPKENLENPFKFDSSERKSSKNSFQNEISQKVDVKDEIMNPEKIKFESPLNKENTSFRKPSSSSVDFLGSNSKSSKNNALIRNLTPQAKPSPIRAPNQASSNSHTNLTFSMFNKGDDLTISNQGRTVTNSKSSFQIAMLKKPVIPNHQYKFKIEGENFGKFCIGLVDINKVQGNNFNMRFKNHAHGCFFIRNNGDFLVDGRAKFFIPPFNLHLKNQTKVIMTYIQKNRVLLFETENGFQQSVLEVTAPPNMLYPALMIFDSNKKITLV